MSLRLFAVEFFLSEPPGGIGAAGELVAHRTAQLLQISALLPLLIKQVRLLFVPPLRLRLMLLALLLIISVLVNTADQYPYPDAYKKFDYPVKPVMVEVLHCDHARCEAPQRPK